MRTLRSAARCGAAPLPRCVAAWTRAALPLQRLAAATGRALFPCRLAAATVAALVSVAAAGAPAAHAEQLRAGVFSPARMAPDFKLNGSDGSEVTLARYRGKIAIVVFGFTACPTVCPTTLRTLAEARKQLGADAAQLQIVYITVDPERDDVERMRAYLASFDPTFVGATGTAAALEAVRREYGIFANRESTGESYSFSHSSYTYLVDRDGRLRALMPYGQKPEDYVHDIRILLEPGPPPS
jgi:protein SCO1